MFLISQKMEVDYMKFEEEVENHLKNKIIPFWKGLKDNVYGGYYGMLNYDLNIDKKAVKGCILNSRIMWFFSNAYLTLKDNSLLDYARHAYDFMINHCIDREYGGIYWSLNFDGSVCDSTKHTYNQAFAIYALATFYEATNDKNALNLAFVLFNLIESKCTDDIGYLESFDRYYNIDEKNEKLSENGVVAKKTMNTLLHVFESYTRLYKVTKNEDVKNRLEWILDTFADKIYNKEKNRQEVFFDENMNSIIDLHSYGHDIETAWLVDRGVEILDNKEYKEKMADITSNLTKGVYDTAYNGFSLYNESCNGKVNKSHIWWVQAEAMVGFFNEYEKDKTKTEYLDAVKNIWTFVNDKMVDKRNGSEWFWEVDDLGNPYSKKPIVEPWKCPYHNGRFCMEILRRCK